MKIYLNSENEKFLEVTIGKKTYYRSFKTGIYYELQNNQLVASKLNNIK